MNDINDRTEELENLFVILAAFEDNLAQYMNIKNKIIEASTVTHAYKLVSTVCTHVLSGANLGYEVLIHVE